jgi:multiple sugar transport system substrate-binding protein/raffinose/stachyose/melibiose transport system substrate-binding protein
VSDPQLDAYVARASRAPLTGSMYYSMLPANTIAMLHPLIEEVLLGSVSPRQAARRLDASIRNEAQQDYK